MRRLLLRHDAALARCHARVLPDHPNARGTLRLEMAIARDGTSAGVSIQESELPSSVGDCVREHARSWRYPWRGDRVVVIRVTLRFLPD